MASTEEPGRGEVWLVSLGAARKGEPAIPRAIRSVSRRRLLRRLGRLEPETVAAVEAAPATVLALDTSP